MDNPIHANVASHDGPSSFLLEIPAGKNHIGGYVLDSRARLRILLQNITAIYHQTHDHTN